ncbi:MAG: flippase-like domain-containing protein [Bacteroidetes bacterium]|nr:flippase-like domain-containing protein [Bacteroidota bacterium]
MAEIPANSPLSQFRPRRVLVPVAIGVAVTLYLVFGLSRLDMSGLAQISLSQHLAIGVVISILTVAVRDIAYIYRMWLLTDRQLSWWRCFEVIMLWEFGSSVTPASVGGVTAIFVLRKEKLSFGKGAAIVLLCSYMDNIAFILVFSTLFLIYGTSMFVLPPGCAELGTAPVMTAIRTMAGYAWIGFLVVGITGSLLGFGIFVKPQWARSFCNRVARIKWLHRWRAKIELLGDEIWYTSREFKTRGVFFLLKVLIATVISWTARYALANALIWTFTVADLNMLDVFVRQCLLRVITFIPTTPGGSGVSELGFIALNCDYLPAGLTTAVAIIWRLLNFYLYLGIGAIVLPRWIVRVNRAN